MNLVRQALLLVGLSFGLVGCLVQDSVGTGSDGSNGGPGSGSPGDPPECVADADCAYLDQDQDVCTRAACRSGKCEQQLVKGTAECQCHGDDDCAALTKDCSVGTCAAHKCSQQILPAGPAKKQVAGDCNTLMCDGVALVASKKYDDTDLPDDNNECTVEICEGTGVKRTNLADGTACGAGGICFKTRCVVCTPQNPTSCGGEGTNEPLNDTSASPAPFSQNKPFCAFSDASDVDWYTFHANDSSLSHDVLRFEFFSAAPELEVCAYVKCQNGGTPSGGGCSASLPGPGGSLGCCWTGAPNTLKPSWDLDCLGTSEDSGTVWVSVRTPGSSACETYAMTGGY